MKRPLKHSPWTWVPTLYLAEGMPYVVIVTLATIMYKCMGVSNSRIALITAWFTLPWVIKPLWSPLVDIFSTKRRWIVTMQTLLAALFAAIAFAMPAPFYFNITAAAFMMVAFLSATHDIAADGFYILALDKRDQSWFVGIRTTFYRAAMILGQGPLVILAGTLQNSIGVARAWQMVFVLLSVLFTILTLWHIFSLPRPAADRPDSSQHHCFSSILTEFTSTFRSFFAKPHAAVALLFMLLYKLPEAQLVKLITPFMLDSVQLGGLGLDTAQVGIAYGTIGVAGLLAGGIAGGILVARQGLQRWLLPMAWSMSLTCLTFVYLSFAFEPSLFSVNLCVFIEQTGYGFGCTAYAVYLMQYAGGHNATSHYSIATGFMSLGMMLPAMCAGAIQQMVGYRNFFIWTMLCCVVTIAVAWLVRHKALSDKNNL